MKYHDENDVDLAIMHNDNNIDNKKPNDFHHQDIQDTNGGIIVRVRKDATDKESTTTTSSSSINNKTYNGTDEEEDGKGEDCLNKQSGFVSSVKEGKISDDTVGVKSVASVNENDHESTAVPTTLFLDNSRLFEDTSPLRGPWDLALLPNTEKGDKKTQGASASVITEATPIHNTHKPYSDDTPAKHGSPTHATDSSACAAAMAHANMSLQRKNRMLRARLQILEGQVRVRQLEVMQLEEKRTELEHVIENLFICCHEAVCNKDDDDNNRARCADDISV